MASVSAPDVLPPAARSSGPRAELAALLATVVGCVLLAAPVGLLWAAVSPRVEITVQAGSIGLADPTTPDFIATDGIFLALVAAAGVVSGVLALLLGRRHGLGCVVGLAVGGLLAAEVVRRTGFLVGLEEAQEFVAAGADGSVTLTTRLRALPALAGWPIGALLVHMAGTYARSPGRS